MIEAFLICALAIPPSFIGPEPSWQAIQWVASSRKETDPAQHERFLNGLNLSTDFLNFHARSRHKTRGRGLFISDHSVPLVLNLRRHGMPTFGLISSKAAIKTPYHAIGTLGHVPFKAESFLVLYWLDAILNKQPWNEILRDTTQAIEQGGFLIFQSGPETALWEHLLGDWGWRKAPVMILDLGIWQKPIDNNPESLKDSLSHWLLKHRGGVSSPVGHGIGAAA